MVFLLYFFSLFSFFFSSLNSYKCHTLHINKEFQILRLLLEREGVVVSRQELIEKIWQNCGGRSISNNINVHIRKLRKKIYLSTKSLITIRGVGYRFDKQILCRK